MKHYKDLDRTASLNRLCPDLYDHKSVLYIGARPDRKDYLLDFESAGYQIQILEVFTPNAEHLMKEGWFVIEMDVRDFPETKRIWDVIFWWHGPEHVGEEDLPKVLARLEAAAKKMVVLGCPWGNVPQSKILGNPAEEHLSFLDENFFEERGYTTETLGVRNARRSNITAVKYV